MPTSVRRGPEPLLWACPHLLIDPQNCPWPTLVMWQLTAQQLQGSAQVFRSRGDSCLSAGAEARFWRGSHVALPLRLIGACDLKSQFVSSESQSRKVSPAFSLWPHRIRAGLAFPAWPQDGQAQLQVQFNCLPFPTQLSRKWFSVPRLP